MTTTAPMPPLASEVLEQLDPNIRRVVATLRAHGFDTFDSGDGSAFDEKEAFYGEGTCIPAPHVHIAVTPEALVSEADRLMALVSTWRLPAVPNQVPDLGVEAVYMPSTGTAALALVGITDEMVP